MKANLVAIGNSRGVRIPKAVLEQAGLRDEVEMEIRGSDLVIRAVSHPRSGWERAFAAMAAHSDDALLDDALLDEPSGTKWDETEWQW